MVVTASLPCLPLSLHGPLLWVSSSISRPQGNWLDDGSDVGRLSCVLFFLIINNAVRTCWCLPFVHFCCPRDSLSRVERTGPKACTFLRTLADFFPESGAEQDSQQSRPPAQGAKCKGLIILSCVSLMTGEKIIFHIFISHLNFTALKYRFLTFAHLTIGTRLCSRGR